MIRRIVPVLFSLLSLAACSSGDEAVDDSQGAASAADLQDAPWTTEDSICDSRGAPTAKYQEILKAYASSPALTFDSDVKKSNAAHDTVKISYKIFRAASAVKEKGAIVLVNGRTESHAHYAELFWDLTRRGFSVYALDHRGQGHSSRLVDYKDISDVDYQKGYVDKFSDYVADLKKFVDTVVLPDRVGKVPGLYALAHSMGGGITTRYLETETLANRPSVFDGVAFSSPMHGIQTSPVAEDAARAADNGLTGKTPISVFGGTYNANEPFEGNELTTSRCRYNAKRAVGTADPATKVGKPTFHWVVQSIDAGRQMVDGAGQIREPVLLMQAGGDSIVDPVAQKALCDGMNRLSPQREDRGKCTLLTTHTASRKPDAQHEGLIEVDAVRQTELDAFMRFISANPAKARAAK